MEASLLVQLLEATGTSRPAMLEQLLGIALLSASNDPDISAGYVAILQGCHRLALECVTLES